MRYHSIVVRRALWPALVLVLGAILAVPSARADETPNKYYRDTNFKFSLKVFREWPQVPVQPGEEHLVAQFYEETARSGQVARLTVWRVEKAKTVTGSTSGGATIPGVGRAAPKDLWDVTAQRLGVTRDAIKDREFDEIKSLDKVEGRYYEFEGDSGYRAIAWYSQDQVDYGIVMDCSAQRQGAFERGFRSVARSFRFFDKKAKDTETLSVLDDVNLDDEKREYLEGSMVSGWDVVVSPEKNYVVVYNTKGSENDYLAKYIAKRIEKIREQIYEVQFPPAQPVDAVSVVRVCGDKDEYMAYGGMQGSAGYWNSAKEELVFYDASKSRKPDDNTISVLYHEAFHQYIFYSVGSVAPHSWFNEGHGDYYAGAEYRGSKFKIKPFAWRLPVVKSALSKGVRAGNNGGYVPLEKLIAFSQRDYYAYPSICYAQGWSLIYFLREIVPRKKDWQEKWGRILDVYFDTLKAEVQKERGDASEGGDGGPDDGGGMLLSGALAPQDAGDPASTDPLSRALAAAFEGVDLAELEEAWKASIEKL